MKLTNHPSQKVRLTHHPELVEGGATCLWEVSAFAGRRQSGDLEKLATHNSYNSFHRRLIDLVLFAFHQVLKTLMDSA
jgi:hypothetical protein